MESIEAYLKGFKGVNSATAAVRAQLLRPCGDTACHYRYLGILLYYDIMVDVAASWLRGFRTEGCPSEPVNESRYKLLWHFAKAFMRLVYTKFSGSVHNTEP